jgi:prepilin-type N-terminal cleavage/methylation domain-containing protein
MKKRAFTLVELLVVIAIIALLMALLMPALRLANDQARAIICVNHLRQLSIAWFTYTTENDGELVNGHVPMNSNFPRGILWVEPPQDAAGNYTGGNVPGLVEDKLRGIEKGLLYPYVKNVKVYHCPGDGRIDIPEQLAYRSYSVAGGANGEGWDNSYKIALSYSEIRNPGTKYIFIEEADNRGWNRGSWVMNLNRTDQWVDPFAIWHNEKSTLGFADSHAEKHNWVDKSTIEMSENQNNFQNIPPNEGEDYRYMMMGFPRSDL